MSRRLRLRDPLHVARKRPYSQINHGRLLLDQLERDQRTGVHPRTAFSRSVPGFWRFQVRIPERPSPALAGTNLIDRTTATLRVEKRTVPVRIIEQRPLTERQTGPFQQKRSGRNPEMIGDRLNLGRVHPDETRAAGTTVPALRAGKRQPLTIPRDGSVGGGIAHCRVLAGRGVSLVRGQWSVVSCPLQTSGSVGHPATDH